MPQSGLSVLFNIRVSDTDALIRNSSELGRAFMVFGTAREWAVRHRQGITSTLKPDVLQAREDDFYEQIVRQDSSTHQMCISHQTQMALKARAMLEPNEQQRRRVNAHELLVALDYDLSCGLRYKMDIGQALNELVHEVRAMRTQVMVSAEDDSDLSQRLAEVFSVEVNGQRVHLTSKEYQMLELLSLRKGTTLTKEMFLNHLYGGMDEPELKIIDVFICKLRKKLSAATDGEHYIETVWGRGYVLRDPAEEKGAA